MALSVVDGIKHRCCSRLKDVTEPEPSRNQSGLHGRCPNHLTEFQRAMGTDEVVEAPNQFEVLCQGLMSSGMAEAATAQIPTTLPYR
jgi:hypothetical protein